MARSAFAHLSDRERSLLRVAAFAIPVILGLYAYLEWDSSASPGTATAAEATDPASIDAALQRLKAAQQRAVTAPQRKTVLDVVKKELAQRERGLIQAATPAQATAELLQIVRRVGRKQPQPLLINATETGRVERLGDHYGAVRMNMQAECRIEQLLNFLVDLSAQPELVSLDSLAINMSNEKLKLLSVRMEVVGVVPGTLAPPKPKNASQPGARS